MQPMHAAVVEAIMAKAGVTPWPAASVATLLALPGHAGLLAMNGADEPLGFVLGRVAADEAEILMLAVIPATRRAGIGSRLLAAALAAFADQGARYVFLEVDEANTAARTLYTVAGFAPVGTRPGYYHHDGVGGTGNALIMALDLMSAVWAQ